MIAIFLIFVNISLSSIINQQFYSMRSQEQLILNNHIRIKLSHNQTRKPRFQPKSYDIPRISILNPDHKQPKIRLSTQSNKPKRITRYPSIQFQHQTPNPQPGQKSQLHCKLLSLAVNKKKDGHSKSLYFNHQNNQKIEGLVLKRSEGGKQQHKMLGSQKKNKHIIKCLKEYQQNSFMSTEPENLSMVLKNTKISFHHKQTKIKESSYARKSLNIKIKKSPFKKFSLFECRPWTPTLQDKAIEVPKPQLYH